MAVKGTQVTAKASEWQGSSRYLPWVFTLLQLLLLIGSQLFTSLSTKFPLMPFTVSWMLLLYSALMLYMACVSFVTTVVSGYGCFLSMRRNLYENQLPRTIRILDWRVQTFQWFNIDGAWSSGRHLIWPPFSFYCDVLNWNSMPKTAAFYKSTFHLGTAILSAVVPCFQVPGLANPSLIKPRNIE